MPISKKQVKRFLNEVCPKGDENYDFKNPDNIQWTYWDYNLNKIEKIPTLNFWYFNCHYPISMTLEVSKPEAINKMFEMFKGTCTELDPEKFHMIVNSDFQYEVRFAGIVAIRRTPNRYSIGQISEIRGRDVESISNMLRLVA